MAEYLIQEETLKALADAFRLKMNSTDALSIDKMRKLVYLMHYNIKNGVTFYDVSGDPMYSYSIQEAHELDALPDAPEVDGYVFIGWSSALGEINTTTTAMNVYAMYGLSGVTTFTLRTENDNQVAGLHFNQSDANGVSVDWGDGTGEEVSNTTGEISMDHTYQEPGTYTISLAQRTGNISFNSSAISNAESCVTDIYIGDNVSVINGAFRNFNNLESAVMLPGVESIGDYTFDECEKLTGIRLPSTVTHIGNSAFRGCSSLRFVDFEECAATFENSVFKNCNSFTRVFASKNNTAYTVVNDILCNKNVTEIILVPYGIDTLIIPDSITNIASSNKACVPSHIHVGSGLTTDLSFGNSYNCKTVTVSDDNMQYHSIDNIVYDKNITSICFVPRGIEGDIEIADGVTSLYESFKNAKYITSVTIPDSVTSIDYRAFQYCSSLTSVTISDGVTSIGSSAFDGCSGLTSITIPDSVTSIGGSAFYQCSALENITIGSGVASIGTYAFSYCENLKQVNIRNLEKWIGVSLGYYNSSPFYYGADLYINDEIVTDLVIPSNVTTVNSYVFSKCSSLTSVVIPDHVTSIGQGVFRDCANLQSITVPFVGATKDGTTNHWFGYIFGAGHCTSYDECPSLRTITITGGTRLLEEALSGFKSVTTINLPEGLRTIGTRALVRCNSLLSLTIPSSVTAITGTLPFNFVKTTEWHLLPITPPTVQSGVQLASGASENLKIYVPVGCLAAYQSASGWSDFANYMLEEPA